MSVVTTFLPVIAIFAIAILTVLGLFTGVMAGLAVLIASIIERVRQHRSGDD